jgi:hypothetical protein
LPTESFVRYGLISLNKIPNSPHSKKWYCVVCFRTKRMDLHLSEGKCNLRDREYLLKEFPVSVFDKKDIVYKWYD